MLADHIIWLSRTGLTRNVNIKKWNELSNKYWLVSIVMNLVRDFYEIIRLLDSTKLSKPVLKSPIYTLTSIRSILCLMINSYSKILYHKNIAVDTFKNVCDVFIPLNALGYTKFSPRTIGILGALSSLAALATIVEPSTKLVPM